MTLLPTLHSYHFLNVRFKTPSKSKCIAITLTLHLYIYKWTHTIIMFNFLNEGFLVFILYADLTSGRSQENILFLIFKANIRLLSINMEDTICTWLPLGIQMYIPIRLVTILVHKEHSTVVPSNISMTLLPLHKEIENLITSMAHKLRLKNQCFTTIYSNWYSKWTVPNLFRALNLL